MSLIYPDYNYNEKDTYIHYAAILKDNMISMEKKLYVPKNSTIADLYKLMFMLHS